MGALTPDGVGDRARDAARQITEGRAGTEALRELLYETLETLRIETTTDDIDALVDAVSKSDWLRAEREKVEIATQAEAFGFTNRVRALDKAAKRDRLADRLADAVDAALAEVGRRIEAEAALLDAWDYCVQAWPEDVDTEDCAAAYDLGLGVAARRIRAALTYRAEVAR